MAIWRITAKLTLSAVWFLGSCSGEPEQVAASGVVSQSAPEPTRTGTPDAETASEIASVLSSSRTSSSKTSLKCDSDGVCAYESTESLNTNPDFLGEMGVVQSYLDLPDLFEKQTTINSYGNFVSFVPGSEADPVVSTKLRPSSLSSEADLVGKPFGNNTLLQVTRPLTSSDHGFVSCVVQERSTDPAQASLPDESLLHFPGFEGRHVVDDIGHWMGVDYVAAMPFGVLAAAQRYRIETLDEELVFEQGGESHRLILPPLESGFRLAHWQVPKKPYQLRSRVLLVPEQGSGTSDTPSLELNVVTSWETPASSQHPVSHQVASTL